MSEAVKSRKAARGWVTRASKRLAELNGKFRPDLILLKDACEEFDKRLDALEEAQRRVEAELKEEEIDDDIEKAADFCERSRVPRLEAARLLVKDEEDETVSTSTVEAKLPKIELPSFSGDVKEWLSFWEQFDVIVNQSELPDVTKFTYLKSLLKDEAKIVVQGLSLTALNYKVAVDILKERYGRKERIVFSHIEELLNVCVPKQLKVPVLWELYDKLQRHVRCLETLDVNGEQYGVLLTPIILSRLPVELRMEWAREGGGHESDLPWLM
jgi:hypothetical protein